MCRFRAVRVREKGVYEAREDVNECDVTHDCIGPGSTMSHRQRHQTVAQARPPP